MFIKSVNGHVISEPRLPPALAQFISDGRGEPGDEASNLGHDVHNCLIDVTQVA